MDKRYKYICEEYDEGVCLRYSDLNDGYGGTCKCGYDILEFYECDYLLLKGVIDDRNKN